jgi:hypothetical protein
MSFVQGVRDTVVKDKAVLRTQKGRTFGKRRRAKLECINGIRDRDVKKQLRLRKKRTSSRIFRKTVELEVVKQIVRTSMRPRKMRDWTL